LELRNMSTDRVPMTKPGLQRLKDELKRLKSVEKPKNVKDIEEARAHGDLSENAEYHAAKERQGQIEAEIRRVEDVLARAEVIDVSRLSGDKVVFGATVELEDVDNGGKMVYRIVGEYEADIKKGLISVSSPIARALIGREIGDSVKVQVPGGARELEIADVRFVETEHAE
jgi:transcription elongation factor GreA